MTSVQKLSFYATPPHNCNYLADREATTLFADPRFPKNSRIYSALADCGFRRSGEHLYIPHCSACTSCIPVRIPAARFTPSANQLRTWKRNQVLSVKKLPAEYRPDHFALYRRYLTGRHAGGGMDNPTPDSYMSFLAASWSETYFYEMRYREDLVCVTVIDMMENALSAVYTFFDPAYGKMSPGKYAILYQIELARNLGLEWLYLGYWIEGCRKMNYKNEYRPLEYYIDNQWQQMDAADQ